MGALIAAVSIFVATGLACQLAERFWPYRRFDKPRTLRRDVLGFLWVYFLYIVSEKLFAAVSNLSPFAGMLQWRIQLREKVPGAVLLAAYIVLADFLQYWMHRLNHSRCLWHTHAAHHSVENMYWLAGARESPIHHLLLYSVALPLTPLSPAGLGIWALFFLATLNQQLIHSNLSWRFGLLEWLLVTPRYHILHHAAEADLHDKNFGFLFTIWDRIFGTYVDPNSVRKDFALGLTYDIRPLRLYLGLPPGLLRQKQPNAR